MFKKILLTTVAALAITVGATSISTPDANAGVNIDLNFGVGWGGGSWGGVGWGGGHWGGYGGHGHGCGTYKVRIKYWHAGHGHFHKKWVWRSYC